ncbi:MAG: hypothetical protein F9K40_17370 [Kofleriaceae bacterium]|nr:MAG: hypothetical protein F9K40_17370 [Kofleriaceae bacterium]MBZ0237338.1 hypothetical protein [Kofleriaceae bacterium]
MAFTAFGACGGDDGGTGIADECNPLGGQTCLLPWPSSAYLVRDDATRTGYRLDLPIEAMPQNIDSIPVDPTWFNRFDGFAPSGPIVVTFANGVSGDNLPHPDRPDESLAADSPIVLVDMDRDQRVPFFAEIDQNVEDPKQRALIIRPLVRLSPASRFAVGLRNTLRDVDGGALESPPAFLRQRDGGTVDHPRGNPPELAGAFDSLELHGLPRSELVLAWDFRTASDEFLTADLLAMRDVGQAAMGDAGANLSFTTELFDADPQLVWKAFSGTFTSPDFLTNDEAIDSVLRRDANGAPQMQGMRDANYAVLVPRCAETAQLPIPTIVFGHGLFGSGADYLDDGFLQEVADQFCFNVIAGDFIGLTMRQITVAALAANDLNKAPGITQKLAQSVIDFIALENLVRGPMAQHAEFQRNGQAIIDPSRVYYLGGSLGGIMGNVFMAYDQNITRGALGVPGGAWSMLFERSIAWSALKGAAQGSYTDPLEYQLLIVLLAMNFEPYDPITTAPRVVMNPMPDTPAKQVMMYEAVGDCLVNNYSTETVARTMGLQLITPSVKTVWGMEGSSETLTSGLTVYDEHPTPLPPATTNVQPSTDNGTHSGVNKRQAVLDQVREFVLNGNLRQMCKQGDTPAACDCATGACGDRI